MNISIIRFESLGSTNTEAANRAIQGEPEGVCIVAREQTAGRGRLERHWSSPKDAGLYFSIILRPTFAQKAFPLITLMTALAVQEALTDACHLRTDIKWPNDILANQRKLCGILAEVVETSLGRAVIVGIGINLGRESLPDDLRLTATSVEELTGIKPELEQLLSSLTSALSRRYSQLQAEDGPAITIRDWSQSSSFAEGKQIRVQSGNEVLEGTTRGIESDGALRIETLDGTIKVIRAGDVTIARPVIVNRES